MPSPGFYTSHHLDSGLALQMLEDDFGIFDIVSLNKNVLCEDIYGGSIRLRKGKAGCVLELGKHGKTVIVEFEIGKSVSSWISVELDPNDLTLETRIGRRFSDLSPFLETAQKIKAVQI